MRNPAHLSVIGKMRLRLKRCPNCGGRFVRFVYGMPSPSTMDAVREGKLILGGCVFDYDSPIAKCSECDTYLNPDFTTKTLTEREKKILGKTQKSQE